MRLPTLVPAAPSAPTASTGSARDAVPAPAGPRVATADVVSAPGATPLAAAAMTGTDGRWTDLEVAFRVPGDRVTVVEPRVWWYGTAPIDVSGVVPRAAA